MKNCKNESGRSMIEMLGVLAIIGVLSVGGIAGYSKAMTKYRINKTIEQITLIAGNIRTFFAPQKNFKGLNSFSGKIIKKAKLVPEDMIVNNSINDLWGGEIGLIGSDKGFTLHFIDGLPEEPCIEILSHDWSVAGVTYIANHLQKDYLSAVPISIENAIKMCKEGYYTFYFDYDARAEYDLGDPYTLLE